MVLKKMQSGIVLLVFGLFATQGAQAQNWKVLFDWSGGHADGTAMQDEAAAVATDTQGNVYVAGSGNLRDADGTLLPYAFEILKFDHAGKRLWARREEQGGGATAMAVDNAGNVVVTNGGFTVRYDTNGNRLWAQSLSSAFCLPGAPVAVDNAGNAYLTTTAPGTNGYDFLTVKYRATDGKPLWTKRMDGIARGFDYAIALNLDKTGGVFVTGASIGLGGNRDILTIKYDAANGSTLWSRRYDGSGKGDDFPYAMTVDGTGNPIVVGSVWNGANTDYILLKYDGSNGVIQWRAQMDGTGHGDDMADAVTTDATGNIYVTGLSLGSSGVNGFLTLKYTPLGKRLWGQRYNQTGAADATSVGVDSKGNVYVTGVADTQIYDAQQKKTFRGSGCRTVKYDSLGRLQWQNSYMDYCPVPGSNETGRAIGLALAVNSQDRVFVAGTAGRFRYLPGQDFCWKDEDILLLSFGP